ncbi:sulfotransferase family protein, partial [Fulvivirga lutimaris]|uniref:sulfotransferase family protein n=1 Tax=Fulvivirga lutimaris TaxID=1819566 RepID=UPI0012BC325F
MSRKLDFICIGATKAGTTSLFYYLTEHDDVYLPSRKEVFFFDLNEEKSWDTFYEENFLNATEDQLIGKFAPRYSRDPAIGDLLNNHNPELKIIYLVRNPVYRAFSHYRMLYRLGREHRNFSDLIIDQLEEANIEKCRKSNMSGEFSLLTQGEYGRITELLLRNFNRDQLLILPSDQLESEPELALKKIYDFLNISVIYPANINKKYHVGGDKARYKWLYPLLKALVLPQLLWKFLNKNLRKKIILWYNTSLRISKKKTI